MKDWKSTVKAVAPILATALGSPVSGMATKLILEGILGKSEGSDLELATALANPDNLAKLKEIEATFKARMKELDVDLERIAVDDRKSARNLASSTSLAPQVIITTILLLGFSAILWMLFFSGVVLDESVKMAASASLGVLGTNVTLGMKFWFGGSPQDAQNNSNMYNAIPQERLKR